VIKLLWAFLGIIAVIYGNANNYRNSRLFNQHCQNLWCLRGRLHDRPPTGVLPYKFVVAQLFKKCLTFDGTEMFIAVLKTADHLSLFWATWIQCTLSLKSFLILLSTYSFQSFLFRFSGVNYAASFDALLSLPYHNIYLQILHQLVHFCSQSIVKHDGESL